MNLFKSVREYWTPVLKESTFLESGMLTPEEFVRAGDQLVVKCPNWSWATCDVSRRKPYLPESKQFLLSRHAICRKRVADLFRETSTGTVDAYLGEDVVLYDCDDKQQQQAKTINDSPQIRIETQETKSEAVPIIVVEDYMRPISNSHKTNPSIRYYDISITYDNYYRTPRVYLQGTEVSTPSSTSNVTNSIETTARDTRDEVVNISTTDNDDDDDFVTDMSTSIGTGTTTLISAEDMFQDILSDYVNRTVTLDPHPFLSSIFVSVHPCKHAAAMKGILDHLAQSGKELKVEVYLFVFLKFVQSVIPTIEYDFTSEVQV